jgi:hypothetical protein
MNTCSNEDITPELYLMPLMIMTLLLLLLMDDLGLILRYVMVLEALL